VTLADVLARELQTHSLRALEARTGVSHTAIARIAKGQLGGFPDIDTLQKLARALSLPLWRVLELAGVDLDLSTRNPHLVRQLESLITQSPRHREVFERLLAASEVELSAVQAYLEVATARPPATS
jgi:transcriptional regulator with XRE-family HTH domain